MKAEKSNWSHFTPVLSSFFSIRESPSAYQHDRCFHQRVLRRLVFSGVIYVFIVLTIDLHNTVTVSRRRRLPSGFDVRREFPLHTSEIHISG